jgi:hypothetical protein
MSEIVVIERVTGHTVAQLCGNRAVATRVRYAPYPADDPGMERMRAVLLHFLELNDHLEGQAIPTGAGWSGWTALAGLPAQRPGARPTS